MLQHSGRVVVWRVFVLARHTAESYSSPGVLLLANDREFVLLVQRRILLIFPEMIVC